MVSTLKAVMEENVEGGAKGALPTPSLLHSLTLAGVSPRRLEAASSLSWVTSAWTPPVDLPAPQVSRIFSAGP